MPGVEVGVNQSQKPNEAILQVSTDFRSSKARIHTTKSGLSSSIGVFQIWISSASFSNHWKMGFWKDFYNKVLELESWWIAGRDEKLYETLLHESLEHK